MTAVSLDSSSRSCMRYPLALCARHWVSVSLSGIVPSGRYVVIGFCQFASRLGDPTIATMCPVHPGSCVIGPGDSLGLAPDIGVGPPSPGGVPGTEIGSPSSAEVRAEQGHRLPHCLARRM
jgi:hypothetical protein